MSGCLSVEHELPGQGCLAASVNVGRINRGRAPTSREQIVLFSVSMDGAQRIVCAVGEGQTSCKDPNAQDMMSSPCPEAFK